MRAHRTIACTLHIVQTYNLSATWSVNLVAAFRMAPALCVTHPRSYLPYISPSRGSGATQLNHDGSSWVVGLKYQRSGPRPDGSWREGNRDGATRARGYHAATWASCRRRERKITAYIDTGHIQCSRLCIFQSNVLHRTGRAHFLARVCNFPGRQLHERAKAD